MKLSELKGKQVVAVGQAVKVGTVRDMVLDSSCQNIMGLIIRKDDRAPEQVVSTKNLSAIGHDVVTIDSVDSLRSIDPATPEAHLPRVSTMMGSSIVTQSGHVLGKIADFDFDPMTRAIGGLEFDGGIEGMLGRHHILDPKNIISVGPGLVTVNDQARPSKAA